MNSLQRVSLDRAASESDLVFVLTPQISKTKNLINEYFLRKEEVEVLINTGRGTVVDSGALANALRTNKYSNKTAQCVEGVFG